jgi:hypothetical protein
VRDAVVLGVPEAGQHALQQQEDLRQRERAGQRAQRPARHVLHRDVGDPVVLEEVEQRHHVRVIELGRQPRLVDEALRDRGIVALEVEALEHDLAVEGRLPHQEDDGHPAPCEHLDDLVAADALSAQGPPSDPTFRRDALQGRG